MSILLRKNFLSARIFQLVVGLLLLIVCGAQYVPPKATILPLYPAGMRISIPDEPGITLVSFHIKINEEFHGLESGSLSVDLITRKNGTWIYENRKTNLKKGDVVYLWTHVVYNGLGYNLLDQHHEVKEYYNYDGTRVVPGSDNVPSCLGSATKVFDPDGRIHNPCAKQLLFEDNFTNLERFNEKQWTIIEKFPNGKDYDFAVYRNSILNVNIENHLLTIKPTLTRTEFGERFLREGFLELERCTGHQGTTECQHQAKGWNIIPPAASGRLSAKKILNFEFGRVEIRAKLPRGDWMYPIIALIPAKDFTTDSPTLPQIRVAASAGNSQLKNENDEDISGHVLWGGAVGFDKRAAFEYLQESRITKYNSRLWSSDFHIYEMIWSINKIELKVDGEKYFEERIYSIPRGEPFYLTIGVAVGGVTEFPDNSLSGGFIKPWKNSEAKALYHFYEATNNWARTWTDTDSSLSIDYIKIYAL